MINEEIIRAKKFFSDKEYKKAFNIFAKDNLTYEAGLSLLLMGDIVQARKYFEIKKDICPASSFGIIILDIIEGKRTKYAGFFQVRAFLEVFLNLLIENNFFNWAQEIVNNFEFFTKSNLEVPKFIARVLYSNEYFGAIHELSKYAKEVYPHDAEIYYIEADVFIKEGKRDEAMECIKKCLCFAPDYYPILKLKKEIENNLVN